MHAWPVSNNDPAWDGQRYRLAICMAISAVAMFLVLAIVDWPPRFNLRNPLELAITVRYPAAAPPAEVRERPQAEARELQQPEARDLQQPAARSLPEAAAPAAPVAPATSPRPSERIVVTEPPAASAAEHRAAEQADWQLELERVAAEVIARAAEEPQSMHPEFEELRRIAALRYSKPRTNKPSSTWQEENSYRVPEDSNLVNRYAFGAFDEDMIQFTIPFGRPRPKNLPWVAVIRARYDYLGREPDELPVLKAAQGNQ